MQYRLISKAKKFWLCLASIVCPAIIIYLCPVESLLNTTQTPYQLKQPAQMNNKSLNVWTVCHERLLDYTFYTAEDLNGSICTNSDIFHSLDLHVVALHVSYNDSDPTRDTKTTWQLSLCSHGSSIVLQTVPQYDPNRTWKLSFFSRTVPQTRYLHHSGRKESVCTAYSPNWTAVLSNSTPSASRVQRKPLMSHVIKTEILEVGGWHLQ